MRSSLVLLTPATSNDYRGASGGRRVFKINEEPVAQGNNCTNI